MSAAAQVGDRYLERAVGLIRTLCMRRDDLVYGRSYVIELTGELGSCFAVAGYDEQRLIRELASDDAFSFLARLEDVVGVNLSGVRDLLIERMADPWSTR